MTTILDVIKRIQKEKTRFYKEICENFKKLRVEKENIEEILKNLEKSSKDFLEEILKQEEFKDKKPELQNIIDLSKKHMQKRDLIEEILWNLKRFRIYRKNRKTLKKELRKYKLEKEYRVLFKKKLNELRRILDINEAISLKFDKSEALENLYKNIHTLWILESILENYQEEDYIEGLKRILLAYRDDHSLEDLIPFLKEIAEEEKTKILGVSRNNLDNLNKNLKKYKKYIKERVSDYFELIPIFEGGLSELYNIADSNLRYRVQQVEKYKEKHENWIENFPTVLNMYKSARKKENIFIREERDALDQIFHYLREQEHEMLETTKKAGYVKPERILKLIEEYNDIYEFERHRRWAEHEKKQYKFLKKK
ncbi:MAG: hypothetical protein V3V33_12120 [Candidatus Lokiarchaeia archaeon]